MSNKKHSFVLYHDYIDSTDELTDEQVGKLFRMILAKVNGRDYPMEDKLLKLVFIPIEKALERDLKKYENRLQEKSQAGRIGNLKRWYPDLYDQFQKGKLDLDEACKIAEHRKTSQSDKSIANIADSVTVHDTVSVTENVSENEGVDDEKEIDINAAANIFWKKKEVLKEFGNAYKIKGPEQLKPLLEEFISHCKRHDKGKKSPKDFQAHFDNWLRKREEPGKTSKSNREDGPPRRFDDEVKRQYSQIPKE